MVEAQVDEDKSPINGPVEDVISDDAVQDPEINTVTGAVVDLLGIGKKV